MGKEKGEDFFYTCKLLTLSASGLGKTAHIFLKEENKKFPDKASNFQIRIFLSHFFLRRLVSINIMIQYVSLCLPNGLSQALMTI